MRVCDSYGKSHVGGDFLVTRVIVSVNNSSEMKYPRIKSGERLDPHIGARGSLELGAADEEDVAEAALGHDLVSLKTVEVGAVSQLERAITCTYCSIIYAVFFEEVV